MPFRLSPSLNVGLLIVDLHILHLQVVLLIFFPSDALASIADFAEGVVEVTAVQTNPIRVGVSFGAVGVLHDRNRNCKYYLTLYILNLFHKTEDKVTVKDLGNGYVVGVTIAGSAILGITILATSLIWR